ncbi:CheR family methyltransferase [Jannaschia pohangensis]|uniref:protein-glutamate O-methyltransferase n=1 Tax=Jannaschia pohangensis TaxID=390807 RepID=A0A1I3H477_9RHOB|nr:CheR family methyltransferase [Jannaschia pohangensis]SFI30588.1 chemotaxis protein methyltransferase CheR [Jannaschia pohangensis]
MIELSSKQYAELAALADREAGLFLPETKIAFVASRLQRRLRATRLDDFGSYLKLLHSTSQDGQAERRAFVTALTTNVTQLFREPHHYELLATHHERHQTRTSSGGRKYQVWSAGCSSGEEALSIAARCYNSLGRDWNRQVSILASDVDQSVLQTARDRPAKVAVGAQLLAYCGLAGADDASKDRRAAEFHDFLTQGIEFCQHNLLHELPRDDRFDAIFCRNVTIYFSRAAQDHVHRLLCNRLLDGGLLALGHSERLTGHDETMIQVGRTAYIRNRASDISAFKKDRLQCH